MNDDVPNIDTDPSESLGAPIVRALRLQTRSWEQGPVIQVEQLLQQFPDLAQQPEAILDLIHNEIFCLRRSGQHPELSTYLSRFPNLAEKMKIQWEVDRLLFDDSLTDLNGTRNSVGTRPRSHSLNFLDVPAILGSYQILEMLGEGGMGAVFKAHHVHLGKVVALKILSPRVTGSATSVARFKREMKAVGSLIHPNIVQAFDAGEVDGIHYIAMELIEDIDLHRLVREQGPLSVADACAAVCQVAAALAAAHAVGVVHRDIKPSNMMMTNGQIKLLDLGLARLVEAEGPSADLTSVTQTFGTPDFMAPEQWDDARFVDHRADLYSVGCTLYFLLSGRPPYGTEVHPTATRKMKAHLLEPIPDLREVRGDLPDAVVTIYNTLMAKDPSKRFSSADELRQALLPYISGDALGSHSAARTAFARQDHGDAIVPPTAPQSLPRRSKYVPGYWGRTRLRNSLIATGLILSLLSLSYSYWPNAGDSQTHSSPVTPLHVVQNPASILAPESISPRGDDESATSLTAMKRSLQLWQLISPQAVADGHFEDVKVEGDLVSLDATGRSRQLWIDFQKYERVDLIAQMSLRIRNPTAEGSFKFVLLPQGQWNNEYYFQVRNEQGQASINISFHDKSGQKILVTQPIELKDEFIDINLTFTKDRVSAKVGGQPVLETPRTLPLAGTSAIAVGGWLVELKRPMVIVY